MRARIFLVPLAILGYLLSAATSVSAQYDSAIDDVFQDIATDVAKVLIIDTTPVEIDGVSYTMAEAQVVATYKGAVSGTILLQVEGGLRADGHQVVVSDQPFLSAHDELEVALVRSPTQNARHAVPGVDGVVYSIVGGLGGVSPVTGELVSQADAVGDFGLTGARFAEFPSDFYVNPANSGVDANATVNAVRSALQTWEDDLGSDIDFTYQGTTAATGSLSDEKNTIYWTATPNPATTYLAQASWITTQTGDIIGFDVVFNRDYAWSAGAASGRFDIATVMLHESGHALGLAHVPASSEIMYFQIQSGAAKGLGAGDRAGVAFLYPAASQDPAHVVAAANRTSLTGSTPSPKSTAPTGRPAAAGTALATGWFSNVADGDHLPRLHRQRPRQRRRPSPTASPSNPQAATSSSDSMRRPSRRIHQHRHRHHPNKHKLVEQPTATPPTTTNTSHSPNHSPRSPNGQITLSGWPAIHCRHQGST